MIRTMAGLKRHAALSACSIALISAACSDDDGGIFDGGAGTSSGAGNAGKANGGSGTTAGNSSGGSTAGSSTTGGKANAGASGGGGTSAAGTSGSAGEGGVGMAGMPGMAGEGGVFGEGGEGGGGASEGGAGGEGGAAFVPDVLDNPGFETGTGPTIPGWTNEGTPGAAYVEYATAHTGFGKLSHWTAWDANAPPYTARTYQTVGPIPNGTYSFSMWVDRGWFDEQYLFARDFDAGDAAAEKTMVTAAAEDPAGYVKITLSGIVVTNGKCTVGVYSSATTGTYTNFDDAELTLE